MFLLIYEKNKFPQERYIPSVYTYSLVGIPYTLFYIVVNTIPVYTQSVTYTYSHLPVVTVTYA